jgi:hypothetical protein
MEKMMPELINDFRCDEVDVMTIKTLIADRIYTMMGGTIGDNYPHGNTHRWRSVMEWYAEKVLSMPVDTHAGWKFIKGMNIHAYHLANLDIFLLIGLFEIVTRRYYTQM